MDTMDIDKEFDEEAMDKEEEEGRTNGSQERESGGSSETSGAESNGRSEQSNGTGGQSGGPAPVGGGSQSGSSGGNDGNDEEKKQPTDKMDLDRVEVRVKEEPKEEEKERKSEMSQDEKDRLSSIAKLAAERTQNGEAMDCPPLSDAAASGLIALHHSSFATHIVNSDSPSRHAPPQPLLSNGASHPPNPVPLQPGSQPDLTTTILPIISEPAHKASGSGPKPTLPSLSSIHQLADAALHSQGYSNTSQPGHFSPPQAAVSIVVSQRSSDTPQPVPISPPAPNQAQAGYGPEGAHTRKPMHHMTVQERAPYVHAPPPPTTTYYAPMQYQYTPINEEMRVSGPPPCMQAQAYAPPPQHIYAPGRELPGLGYAPAAPYHYSHEAPSAEPQPLRRGSAANMFAQPPFEEQHPPSGPPTGETMISVAGSDDTIVAPQMSTPKRSSTGSRSDGAPITGTFRCEHAGCSAPPFQTQYLLNSHANVHSINRPHFCHVPGCPRGEKGRGFKRKNEMIRHGLVHDSPGYVCPFCPDREHKYPRPDNLQRYDLLSSHVYELQG
ncbi:hypothetical protein BGX38DRAFT_1180155 [Terfezia claveryi]|nr:hypothetical protein BGX38DRAFT_1180155 [Terfezia claveryi]